MCFKFDVIDFAVKNDALFCSVFNTILCKTALTSLEIWIFLKKGLFFLISQENVPKGVFTPCGGDP